MRKESVYRRPAFLLATLAILVAGLPARAANLVQDFYLPMPEAQISQANSTIVSGTAGAISSTFSIVVTGDGTVIYYDQWEDGYEVDLGNPTQPTTQIWGDGNDAHGIPPGFAHNPLGLKAGTVITLTNSVTLPRNPSQILWDARDHVAANKALVISRAGWPTSIGPVFAGAAGVLSTIDYGTNYISPVGQDLAPNLFKYVGMFIMAAQNNTAITIDPNGNGVGTTNIVLNQGESYLVNGGVKKGGRVTATKPIQADLVIGHVGSSYASDWFTLYPVSSWDSSYYTAVGSAASGSQPAYVYLFNPATNAITINYTTRAGSGSFVIPGTNGVYQFQMPVSSGASFVSAGGQNFFAICTVAANNSADTSYNWGFTLVPKAALTTKGVVGWGPGSADGTVNGSPVWVTTLANTTLYVDYKGDHAGPLAYTNGGNIQYYDTNFTVSALQTLKVYDPSKNQTGMQVFTVDGTLLTAAWGEDPDVASPGNPYIDAGTTVIPFPTPVLFKSVTNLTSSNGLHIGDTLQYIVEVDNKGLLPLGNTVVIDTPTTNLTYVTNSTTWNGAAIADNPGPYSATNTAFPLDGLGSQGYTIPVILSQGTSTFVYQVKVNAAGAVSNSVNIGGTTIFAQTVVPTAIGVSVTLNFTDTNGVSVASYLAGAKIFVTMTNAVGNSSTNTVQTISVTVTDTNTGDAETIPLVETGTNTGVFRNVSGLPASSISGLVAQDGTLYVTAGDTLGVSYADPVYGDSASTTAAIQIPTPNKQLYLTANGVSGNQFLNRVNPALTANHGTTYNSVDIGGGGTISGWPYRQVITINHANVNATDQTNFPVLVNLAANTGLQNHAQASGNDILFTASDGTTVLAYEREKYVSGTGALVAWVKIPVLSHTTDTVVYMYYGNGGASDQQNAAAVWDTNYKGVWHLNQTPTGATGDIVDSTGGNNGTSQTIAAGAQVAGKIGGSLTLSGTNNYISTATSFNNPQAVMLEAWVKTTTTNGYKVVGFEANQTGTGSATYDRHIYFDTTGHANFGTYNGGTQVAASTNVLNDGQWHFLVGYRDNAAATISLYVDGVLQATTASSAAQNFTGWYRIGGYKTSGWPGLGGDGYFAGSVDEIKLSHFVRSAGWIKTEYTNQASPATFYSIGSEATVTSNTNTTTFTQTPPLALPFTMPAGGVVSITNFIAITNGVGNFTGNLNITATLQTNGVNFLTLTNPVYTGAAGVTNLVWTGTPLAANYTLPANTVITYVVTNNLAGTAFHVNYDSTNSPSQIVLPASTVIAFSGFAVYDAPYPGGNLVSTPIAGTTVYVRAAVTDPFGSYDITSLGLAFTAPNTNNNFSVTLNDTSVVFTNASTKTYEYAWNPGPATGGYTIAATANEGTEGVKANATAGITTIYLDLGTPSVTEFTSGNNGSATNAYLANSNVCVRVTDLNRNTNAATVETIAATIRSSFGDVENLTLTETGTNTGVFTGCINSTTNTGTALGNGTTLVAPVGNILTVNYSDPTDASDNTSATAVVQPLPGVPGIVMNKTIVSPTGGQVGVGKPVVYNLQVVNVGSTLLTNVSITDTFTSARLSFTSASVAPNVTNAITLTWTNLGVFAPGQSTNLTVNFTTLATGSATNSATAGSTSVTNSASVTIAVNSAALNVVKTLLSPTNSPVSVGSNVVFRITFQNVGNTVITYLPFEDNFSGAYFQYVSATIPANGSGYGSLIWTNIAGAGLATNAVITNDMTMTVVGAGNPANNTAVVDYATDIFGNPVPTATGSTNVVTAAASITGHVYNDKDQSGTLTVGDTGLGSVTLRLFTDPNGDGNPADGTLVQSTTTDVNGYYEFLNLSAGHYDVIVQDRPPGFASVTPTGNQLSVNLPTLTASTNNNFFDYQPSATLYSTISGTVYNDLNGGGTNYAGIAGLAYVSVELFQDVNTNGVVVTGDPIMGSTTTDANGNYSFAAVSPGHYVIRETDFYGYYSTGDSQAPNNNQIPFVTTNGITSGTNNFFDRLSPVAVADTNSALYFVATVISPLTNDLSPNGDALTISNAVSTNGIAVINPGSTNLTFTPTNLGATTITYTITDAHGGTSTNSITVNVTALADLAVGKTAAASVFAASNLVYTISVTNLGPTPASSIVVTDALPAGVSFVNASGGGANNSGVVSWTLGSLTSGQITNLILTVTSPASGTLTNTANVSSPTPDPTLTNNVTPPVVTTVTPVADLAIAKSANASVLAASNLVYTISVTNLGPSTASSVVVTDTLPASVSFVSASGNGVNNSGVVNWALGALINGQATNLSLTVKAPASGTLTNVANVNSPTGDPNSTNNVTPPVVTTVTPVADLAVGKTGAASGVINANFSYTISVTNLGPSAAASFSVTDSLPAGMVFVSSLPATVTNAANQAIWNVGSLAANVVTNFTLTVQTASRTTFTNVATAGSPTLDPAPTNNASAPVVTSITNRPPVAVADSAASARNVAVTIPMLVNDSDPDGDTVTIFSVSPTNGTFSLSGGSIIYTPTNTVPGTNVFTYTISDGFGGTATASVTVAVTNRPPVAVNDFASTTENVSVTVPVLVNDSDPDGDALTIISTSPTNGIASISGTNVVFTPETNFTGTATCGYGIRDNFGGTNFAVINITVTNIPPMANPDSYAITENTTNSFAVLLNDVVNTSGGSLTLLSVSTTNGTANVSGTNVVFTPATNYRGTLTLTYTITDNIGGTNSSTVTVTVTNIPPLANPDGYTVLENSTNTFTPLTNDVVRTPGGTLQIIGVSPTNGTANILNLTNIVFTPSSNFIGTATVGYTITDGIGGTNSSVITVTVQSVSDLSVSKSGPATVYAATNFNYTITVTNLGPGAAANLSVTDNLPAAVSFVSSTAGATLAGSQLVWTNLGLLAANAATNLTVTVTAPVTGVSLTNLASTGSPTSDPNPTNNTSLPVVTAVTPVADLMIAKAGPASVLATSNVLYTISVTNFGPSSASSVVVTDALPAGVTFISANGNGTNNSGVVTWNLGTLAGGAVSNLTVTVTAPASGSLTNIASISSPTTDTNILNNTTPPVVTTVGSVADLAIGKSAPASVFAVSNLSYTISVTNYGPSTASSVTVTDNIPNGASFVNASGGGANNSGTVIWNLGDLPKNVVSNLTLTVTAPASGTLTNMATVGSPTGDPNATNNTTPPVLTSVTPLADLVIAKVGSATVFAASNLSYTISVTNLGPSSASGVVVTDTLPNTVSFVSASGNGTNNSGVVTWNLGTLANGAASNLTLTVTAPASGSLTNIASVGSPTGDTNILNNTTPPVITAVTPLADVSVVKSGPAGILFGTNFNYTITVSNAGPSIATSLSVTDSLPTGLAFVSAVPATTTNTSNQVIWNLGNFAAGTGSNLTLTVISTLRGSLTNFASGGSPTGDPNPTNNTASPVVTAVTNNPPVANPDNYVITENTTNTFSPLLNDTVQTPGGALQIIGLNPTNGTATILNLTNVVFTPSPNFLGTATIGYTITDGVGGTNSSVITVLVTNIPPTANPDSYAITENTTNVFTALPNDFVNTPGGSLTLLSVSTTNGTVNVSGTNIVFTPAVNYLGTLTLNYTIIDNIGGTNSSFVTVLVTNIPPIANPDSYTVPQNSTNTLTPLVNDFAQTPGGALQIIGVSPTNGTANILNLTNIIFTPTSNFVGTATIGYTITDGIGGTNASIITVTVSNLPPTANAQSVSTPQNTALPITLTGSDPANFPLTFIIVSSPAGGTLTGLNTNTGAVTYTPTNDFIGTDTFTFRVNNGHSDSVTATVTVTVSPVADLLVAQSGPVSGVAGANLVFTVAVTNLGPAGATNVVVTNQIDSGYTFVSASASGATNGNLVTWTIPVLPANGATNFTVTLFAVEGGTFTNTASGISTTPDLALANNDGSLTNAQAITTVSALADVAVFKTGTTSVQAGGTVNYSIVATNFGPSTASNVVVRDMLPAGATLQTASGNYFVSNGVIVWDAATLAGGAATNFIVTLTAPASGTLTNIGSSISDTADPNPGNNDGSSPSSVVATPVTLVADLSIGKSAAASVLATSNLVYTISVTNLGPSTASSVTVTDAIPAGAIFASASGNFVNHSGVVVWNLGDLASGAVSNMTLTVTPPTSGSLTNSATVGSPTSDPNSTNNVTPPVVTIVTPVADIAVGKSGPIGATFNTNFSYTISVTNFGPSAASGILVTDTLPAGIAFVSAVPSTTTNLLGQVIWSVGNLAANATTNLSLTVISTARGAVTNFATVGAPTLDPSPTNNLSQPVVTLVTNIPPVANADSYVIAENSGTNTFAPLLNDTVRNPGGVLQIISVNTTNGSATVSGTNVLFVPGTNYFGSLTIGYTIIDNAGGTNSSVITVLVTNIPPTANPDNYTIGENSGTNTFSPLLNDVLHTPGGTLQIIGVSPTNGTATVSGTNVLFKPNTNFFGTATIGYTITDGIGGTNSSVITVTVTNIPPVANGQSVGTTENTAVQITLTGSDPNGLSLKFAIVGNPVNGTLTGLNTNTGVVTYVPGTNYTGADSFTFRVNNGQTNSAAATVSLTVTPVADLVVVQSGPASGVAGSNLVFTVSVTNRGPATATGVAITNQLASGFTFVSASGSGANSGNLVTWSFASLSANGGTNFTVTAFATEGGTFTNIACGASVVLDLNATNNSGSLTNAWSRTTVSALADVQVFKDGGTNVYAGQPVDYTITATNAGPSTATSVVVQDNLPSGAAFQSASGSYTATNGVVTWSGFTLAPGTATTFSLTMLAPASSNSFINIALATSPVADPNPTNNNGSLTKSRVTTKVAPSADVVVVLNGPASAIQGSNFVYTISVTNTGPSTSSNLITSDTLPPGLTFVSASSGGTTNGSNVVAWPAVVALPVGGVTNYSVTVRSTTSGDYTNIVSEIATTYDPNATNNSGVLPASRVRTTVAPAQFTFLAGSPVFNPQTGLFEETVTVTNNGSITVLGFRLNIGGLRSGVSLWNANGTNNGVPYINYNFPLDPSNATTVVLEFFDPTRLPFTNTVSIEVITPANLSYTGTNGSVAVSRVFMDTRLTNDTRFVIEFASTPGKTYAVIYNGSLTGTNWLVATPSVKANANVTQWYDDGPPKTISKPTSVLTRFYRVIQY
jgi:uncharacterized repeat protein (TIGR01451 family)